MVRILKEMRNSINRQVNCETANIKKTVSAAARQTEDIRYIHDTIGFGNLSENLSADCEITSGESGCFAERIGTDVRTANWKIRGEPPIAQIK